MTNVPLYRQAIRDSWQLAWHNKLLWIFGLFAAFLGQMGLLELFIKVGLTGSQYAFFPNWLILPEFFRLPILASKGAISLPIDGWMWLIWLTVIILGFIVLLIFVSISSQGAIVHAAAQDAGKKKKVDVDRAWSAGVSHFWRLFFLNLVKKIVLLFLAIVLGNATVGVILGGAAGDDWLFVSLFILSAIVGIVLSIWVVYAAGYVVVEEQKLLPAIEKSWRLLWDHWLVSLEVGAIILFLNIVLGAVVLASFFLFFIPTLLLWLLAVSIVSASLYYVAMIIGVALFTLFVVFLGSVFSVFTTSAWTYLFMKMHKKGITSRLLYWGRFHK